MSPRLKSILIIAGVTLVLLLLPVRHKRPAQELPPPDTLRCVVPARIHQELVLKYAEDQGVIIDVKEGAANLDSLAAGIIDLAVVPDTLQIPDGTVASTPFLQTVWVVRDDETEALRRINHWMTEAASTRLYRNIEKGKLDRLDVISRYDKLIRKHAAAIGWDWRLVAAIIFCESRFNNDATSHKGAQGLMQILSSNYTQEEVSDPDRNLEIGTRYLRRLQKMYAPPVTADETECLKFVLASYNAGEGKIQRCIEEARAKGLDTTRWAPVSTVLPQGHHTVSYVEKVLDTYRDYSRIFPANLP